MSGHIGPPSRSAPGTSYNLALTCPFDSALCIDTLARCYALLRNDWAGARWVVGSILHGVYPLSYFSFQPVLHDLCNKCRGM